MLTKLFLFFLLNHMSYVDPSISSSALTTKTISVKIDKDSIKSRIEYLNSKTPFQIDYTPLLEETIINHLENRQATFIGLYNKSDYFFPIF
jgi:membrane-bound lytic murein transglycosylase D